MNVMTWRCPGHGNILGYLKSGARESCPQCLADRRKALTRVTESSEYCRDAQPTEDKSVPQDGDLVWVDLCTRGGYLCFMNGNKDDSGSLNRPLSFYPGSGGKIPKVELVASYGTSQWKEALGRYRRGMGCTNHKNPLIRRQISEALRRVGISATTYTSWWLHSRVSFLVREHLRGTLVFNPHLPD